LTPIQRRIDQHLPGLHEENIKLKKDQQKYMLKQGEVGRIEMERENKRRSQEIKRQRREKLRELKRREQECFDNCSGEFRLMMNNV
jgi:hypothetical protein